MIDSTPSGTVVDQSPTSPAQLVVETHTGRQAEEALQDALSEPVQGAGSVSLQGEQILAGPEDGLDALADGGQMRPLSRLVPSLRPHHGSPQALDSFRELP